DFLLNSNENISNPDSINYKSDGFLQIDLKKVKLKNTLIHYLDDSAKIAANMFFPKLDFSGKLVNEQFSGNAEGELKLTNCRFENTNLNRLEDATFNFKIEYENDTLKIRKLEAETEGTKIEMWGKIAFSNTLFTDLALEINELELGKFSKYVPD